MPKPAPLSVDWSMHRRCLQCGGLFGDSRARAAAIIDLEVAGVFHEHCWPAFEASSGHKVQAIVPYPAYPAAKAKLRRRVAKPMI